MARSRLLVAACLVSASFAPAVARSEPGPLPPIPKCTHDPVPVAVGIGTDELAVNVGVFATGGVTPERARQIAQRAAAAYAGLRIRLNVAWVEPVDWPADSTRALMAQAAAHLGGTRPAGTHVVAVVTGTDLVSFEEGSGSRNPGIAGEAKCVGGVRWDDEAFFVAEDLEAVSGIPAEGREYDGVRSWTDQSAKVFTHEMGHLFGAYHHYATCGPMLVENPGTLNACSVMLSTFQITALEFGPADGAVVRGYAEAFTTTASRR